MASNKPTWSVDSKSGYASSDGDPSLAVNDDYDTCMTTSPQPYPWWAVDMQKDIVLFDFVLYGVIVKNGKSVI